MNIQPKIVHFFHLSSPSSHTSSLANIFRQPFYYAMKANRRFWSPLVASSALGSLFKLARPSTPPLDSGSFSTALLSRVRSTQGTILSDRVRASVEFRLEFSTHRFDGSWSDSASVGQERDANLPPWVRPFPGPFFRGRTGRTVSIVDARPSIRWSRNFTWNRCG